MDRQTLIPILTLTAIALGAGYMLTMFGRSQEEKFDERQLIERGKAANFALNVAVCYVLCLFLGYMLELLRSEALPVLSFFGLMVTTLANCGWCIFRDAYLHRDERYGPNIRMSLAMGALSAVMAWHNRSHEIGWIQLAMSVNYLGMAAMLFLRWLMGALRDRAEEEQNDGEE